MFCSLSNSAWADEKVRELSGQVGNWVEHSNTSQSNPDLRGEESSCKCLFLQKLIRRVQLQYCFYNISKSFFSARQTSLRAFENESGKSPPLLPPGVFPLIVVMHGFGRSHSLAVALGLKVLCDSWWFLSIILGFYLAS